MRSQGLLPLLAFSLSLALFLSSPLLVAAQEAEGSTASTSKSAADHLRDGTFALTTGQYGAAVHAFDAAIAADPSNYLTYYRRATAQLSLGRSNAALEDLDKLIALNANFDKAHLQKGKVLAKEGRLDEATKALGAFLKLKKADEEGTVLKLQVEEAIKELKALAKDHAAVQKSIKSAKEDKNLEARIEDCIKHAGKALDVSPSHLEARRFRADCFLAKGDLESAVADWSRVSHLAPSPTLQLRLSSLSYYILGGPDSNQRDAGLRHLKTCLNSDPDNKRCAKAHRRLRAFEKTLKKAKTFADSESWRAVLSTLKGTKVGGPTVPQEVEAAIRADAEVQEGDEEPVIPAVLKDPVGRSELLVELRDLQCKAHVHLEETAKAKDVCAAVLERDPENIWALVAVGDEHLRAERYEEAARELNKAFELQGKSNRFIHAKLTKAQKLLKQAKTKDYYKVLEIPRDADERAIKKAYRKMAKLHHPDKGGSPEKMAAVNEAFGVLNDPELKARFDAGDDPNDPMAGQQQGGFNNPFMQQGFAAGGHPFAQFFQQAAGGGGGGQQFFQFQQGGGGGGGHAGSGHRFHFGGF